MDIREHYQLARLAAGSTKLYCMRESGLGISSTDGSDIISSSYDYHALL